ncbi:Tim44/TimA family putative adaptor protein [Novosphingobium sp. KACC 22771]|uniref:Tim44/TimA family putative adaptor protein n=1 Tax=Novosphingobium sp. KACC 22771 TaxID=3025670 RepID=UPI002365FC12|nr:Tim44/TimA family putative adaptor protein [Novosphingobium sp. KACC 22771]WDF72161.1 Tim44/TimA family putative adaptor protein [Novosphingobium sp. KACC 22771]
MTVSIVILAMIAAFLGMRLYSVLGRRAEHGEEPVQSRLDAQASAAPAALPLPERAVAGSVRPRELGAVLPGVERGLREIISVDRRFDPVTFVEGARSAYRMVLDAFWRGDRAQLSLLCDAEVARSFIDAIDTREAAGETFNNSLVRIEETQIVGASYAAPFARVSVRFVADVAAVTRDREGKVIAGSLNDAVEVRDVWTFRRDIHSADPDWLLEETDEG